MANVRACVAVGLAIFAAHARAGEPASTAPAPKVRVLVVYYSRGGYTEKMAQAVGEGIRACPAQSPR